MKNIKTLSQSIEIINRKRINDSRGWFLKPITGTEKGLPHFTGEIYTVYSENGASRGGHYHKKAKEWFTLLSDSMLLSSAPRHRQMTLTNLPRVAPLLTPLVSI